MERNLSLDPLDPATENIFTSWDDVAAQLGLTPGSLASILTTNGDIITRTAGVPARITRTSLADDPAFTSRYETITNVRNRAILVSDYGTLGTADDSTVIGLALADASGRRVVFPPNATLNCGENVLTNTVDAVIDGNGTTLALKSTGARILGLRLAGTCKAVKVERLHVKGNTVTADAHGGIGNNSGATLEDITVRDCKIEDTTLGVSFNADGSGSVKGILVTDNQFRNIYGTAGGYGYGVHVAISATTYSGVKIIGNTIVNAQRHAIYQAKGVGVVIANNSIAEHRSGLSGSILPAIMASRSGHVAIIGNSVVNSAGGALYLGGVDTGSVAGPFTVIGNTFQEVTDSAAVVYIGQQDPATENTVLGGALLIGNTVERSNASGAGVVIFNGFDIKLMGNHIRNTSASAGTLVTINGVGVTGVNYMDRLSFVENHLYSPSTNTAGFRWSPGADALTHVARFDGNTINGGMSYMFTSTSTLTNPNVSVQNQGRNGLSITPATASLDIGGATTTSAPSAGGAGALPATPAGYATVNINGTARKIPYY